MEQKGAGQSSLLPDGPAESCLAAWRLALAPVLRPGRRGDHGPEPCSQGIHAVTHAATGQRRTRQGHVPTRGQHGFPSLSVTSSRLPLNKTQLRRPPPSMCQCKRET